MKFRVLNYRTRSWRGVWAIVLVLASASLSAAQPEPRHVLLLHSFDREFAPFDTFAGLFRTELSRQSSTPIMFLEVSVRPGRFTDSPEEAPVVSYILSALAGRGVDLVVSVGGPAATFAQKYRRQLFPATPLILASVDRRFVQHATLTPNDTAVADDNDPLPVVRDILQVLPETTHVFVVIGTSPLEQFWRAEFGRLSQRFEDRLTFLWSNEMSFAQILERARSLPPHSAIFYAILARDAKGVPLSEERALPQLHAAANAPIFGLHSPQLGRGIVGGSLISIDDLSRNTVKVALRILKGEPPATIQTPIQIAGPPTFDWRELQRWGIHAARLPPDSIVRFREPTPWERYRWPVSLSPSAALLEGLLVLALLTARVRRRNAERSLRESEERFRLLSDSAPVMVWMSGLDKRCTDLNRSWLAFTARTREAELGDGWIEGVHPDDRAHRVISYAQAFDRREPFRIEYRLRRHDGEYRWILDSGMPRFTEDGAFLGYIGSAIDITELRLAKAALADLSHRLMDAQEDERRWIARELHDDFSQRLVLLTLQLHGISEFPSQDAEQLRALARDVNGQLNDLGRDLQALSHRLHSSRLELLGLSAALEAFCKELAARLSVEIAFHEEGVPRRLPPDIRLCLFRVAQEALNNALKHAGARRVSLTLRGDWNQIQLEVSDDGVGFDVEAATTRYGLGLVSMRERLSLVDGELFLDSRPGAGTRVRASVPSKVRELTAAQTPA
jgi:PAS domain S-box-containing protein